MIAGPNGSGKSTIKSKLPQELVGVYINPDEIEQQLQAGALRLSDFGVEGDAEALRAHFAAADWVNRKGANLAGVAVEKGVVLCDRSTSSGYEAAVLSDFIRQRLIKVRASFSFETVMSSRDKIELLRTARLEGYRTYLYYVGTEDPEINVSRVHQRVALGGHSVPEEKVRSRYRASMDNLLDAVRATDRAFFWDNSGTIEEFALFAEMTDGTSIEARADFEPAWFKKAVRDKLEQEGA
jgi:predicted ABC-type ATPase